MIPFSTTTVAVRRSDQDGTLDLTDTLTWTDVRTGVRAVIGNPAGSEIQAGGSQSAVMLRLNCDPIADLDHADRIVDETTGQVYEVLWAVQRGGLGLEHTVAGLQIVEDLP